MPKRTPTRLLGLLISRFDHWVTERMAEVLGDEGCTVEEWRILVLLCDGAGHTMSEVADFAMLPAPTLTKLVDGLVADNIAYRRVDSMDRRRVRVYLTPRGKAWHRRLSVLVDRLHEDFANAIGPEEADQLEELLGRLVDRLDSSVHR
jgi:DNA-binding MarR family transcriptional regulator